jgi:uncharacterized metal-binding protein
MDIQVMKVGIVSCSGEDFPEGTLSRIACRKVLDELKPNDTVTICLPLFIAGGQEERDFASKFPTITVDGCEKRCAQISTERISGKPSRSLLIPEILKRRGLAAPKRRRHLGREEKEAAQAVAEEIAKAVDEILEE